MIAYDDFSKIDFRVGTIVEVRDFPESRKPAYKLLVDFGPKIGTKASSAQITEHYTAEDLVGKQIIAVVNFSKKQIGPFMSEVLILGFPDENDAIVLATPDKKIPLGKKLF